MANVQKNSFFEGGDFELNNAQFDALLETLAKLIEVKASSVKEAAEIVRNTKTTA